MNDPNSESRNITRREFGGLALGSVATLVFGQTLLSACGGEGSTDPTTSQIVNAKAAPIVKHWALELQEVSADLRSSSIPAKVWQERIEALFARIELKDLLRFIDFETLKQKVEMPELGVGTIPVVFPEMDGLPAKTVFVKKIFGLKKGRAIVPHGHSNMASAHLILKGGFELKHYDKVADEGDRLRIRPTIEKSIYAGDASSISDERDNVHWFVAKTDEAFTFDVIMLDLNGGKYDIHNIDIDAAKKAPNGELLAPKIDVKTALKKYGRTHHGNEAS